MGTARRNPLRGDGDPAQSSCIDLRVQVEPEQPTDHEERKRSQNKSLMKHILESPNRKNLMAEICPNGKDEEYHEISQDVRTVSKAQRNLEAHGIRMMTDAKQCESCFYHEIPGHTTCKCGLLVLGARDEITEQVLRNVMYFSNVPTTCAFSF